MIDPRALLRLDAIFELSIVGVILALVIAGADLRDMFGLPPIVVLALAAALLAVGVYLWVAVPERSTLRSLALANIIGAFAFFAWVAIRGDAMTGAGIAIVSVIAFALLALGAAEWVTADRAAA